MKTTAARRAAAGKPCLVRIPGACNGDPATVVLAHYSLAGVSGRGFKSPDYMGAYCCSSCHDAVDGRARTQFTKDELRKMHAEGVFRTWRYIELEQEHPGVVPCL